jgi:hypothetical protein
MDPTVAAAAIGVGGTVVVGVAGFSAAIWTTKRTIASAREGRVWDKRAASYEAAITELLKRTTKIQRLLNSSSLTWTVENLAEYRASQDTPEWYAAEGRLQAYSSQQVLQALPAARHAGRATLEAFDKAGEGLAAELLKASGTTLETQIYIERVVPLLDRIREAANESLPRDEELIRLMRTELQG